MPLMDSFIDLLKKVLWSWRNVNGNLQKRNAERKKLKKKKNNRREYSRIWYNYKDLLHTQGDYQEKKEKKEDKYFRQ